MEEFFTQDMIECRLKNQFNELFENRIFIDQVNFFELECCSDDAFYANVGSSATDTNEFEDGFLSKFDGYICGCMNCLDREKFKYHIHLDVVRQENKTEILDTVLKILDGKVSQCTCKFNDYRRHLLDFVIEINVTPDDIKFIDDLKKNSST